MLGNRMSVDVLQLQFYRVFRSGKTGNQRGYVNRLAVREDQERSISGSAGSSFGSVRVSVPPAGEPGGYYQPRHVAHPQGPEGRRAAKILRRALRGNVDADNQLRGIRRWRQRADADLLPLARTANFVRGRAR